MQEAFLHYLWRLKRFDLTNLETTQGEPIDILHSGDYNRHAGPDFTNARLRIGDTLWAGNVEMHLLASDWWKHGHQDDESYANVILHVVLEEDQPVTRTGGQRLPCLELRRRIPPGLSGQYMKLIHQEAWIPCRHQVAEVSELTRQLWLERLLVERLQEKTEWLRTRLEANKRDWEETFYQSLAQSFGMRVNADPFFQLAGRLPLKLLQRHKDQLLALEALLFGQAGLLSPDQQDEYPRKLRREYDHLRRKYSLTPLPGAVWKFLRMRPANFPTIRIAQLATLIHQSGHLFSKMLAAQNCREIEHMFEVRLSNYWKDHYLFDKVSNRQPKMLGRTTVHHFIINTIAPFLFLYGKERQEFKYQDRALRLLEELPPEDNRDIHQWQALGIHPDSAYQTQSLLQLKRRYCDERRCLDCAIGNAILNGVEK